VTATPRGFEALYMQRLQQQGGQQGGEPKIEVAR
jgi:hypothetical protein